ncbi:MAG: hypothetical protein EOO52_10460 [Gammaproteobacteria bacterium]|nr:MAG: hypothetical protein EOO52_10460 [Gammaproteobacteria bacterium]
MEPISYLFGNGMRLLVLLICASLFEGCGGNKGSQHGYKGESASSASSSASPTAQEKLHLVSTSPVTQEVNVNRYQTIKLVFDKNLNVNSVTAENVVLKDDANNRIPVSLVALDNKLAVSPLQRLARETNYSVDALGLQGQSGETLTDGKLLSFTTSTQREWGSAFQVDSTNNASKAHATINGNGNAILVWQQASVAFAGIGYSTYGRETGWAKPGALLGMSYELGEIKIAYVDDEHAVAVWRLNGCKDGTFVSSYTARAGWDVPRELMPPYPYRGSCLGPSNQTISITSNRAGKAIAAYRYFKGSGYSIHTNTYVVAEGWNPTQVVSRLDEMVYEIPNVFINSRGDAFLTFARYYEWYQMELHKHTTEDSWKAVPGSGIDYKNEYHSANLVVDQRGDVTLVWARRGRDGRSGESQIFARRISASLEVGADIDITNSIGDASAPAIAIDPSGNVAVAWSHNVEGKTHIYVNRYSFLNDSWQGIEDVAMDIKYMSSAPPQIAADKDGHIVIVWLQQDGSKINLYSRRYVPSSGWEDARLHSNVNGDANDPHLAFGSDGDAILSWESREPTISKIVVTMFD